MASFRSVWPRGNRCAVTLTFDFDAETVWLSRDPANKNRPVTLSQGKYGAKVAVPRILRLLRRYRVPATFFVPGWVIENHRNVVEEILANEHEIAHHGYLHEWPDTLSLDEEKAILDRGIQIIQDLTGERPRGYRSPAWEFSLNTLRLLVEKSFLYTSNMMDDEIPYLHVIDGKNTDLVELPVQWLLDDAPNFMFGSARQPINRVIATPMKAYRLFASEFDGLYLEGKLFNLTMHPQLTGRPSRTRMLEKLIQHAKAQSDVWFAKCEDVAEYWLKKTKKTSH